jgi:hypothetical protein
MWFSLNSTFIYLTRAIKRNFPNSKILRYFENFKLLVYTTCYVVSFILLPRCLSWILTLYSCVQIFQNSTSKSSIMPFLISWVAKAVTFVILRHLLAFNLALKNPLWQWHICAHLRLQAPYRRIPSYSPQHWNMASECVLLKEYLQKRTEEIQHLLDFSLERKIIEL